MHNFQGLVIPVKFKIDVTYFNIILTDTSIAILLYAIVFSNNLIAWWLCIKYN